MFKYYLKRSCVQKILAYYANLDNHRFYFHCSARSAIYTFFSSLNEIGIEKKVLIPEYICNVVPKAIKRAGWNYISYNTTLLFEPEQEEVLRKCRDASVIVIAPILGSYTNTLQGFISQVKLYNPAIIILIDSAQSIDGLNLKNADAAVMSFNRKELNGFYGGSLIIRKSLSELLDIDVDSLSFLEELKYLKSFVRDRIKAIFNLARYEPGLNGLPDYSYCKDWPYQICKKDISLLSLIVANRELKKIGRYRAIREQNYNYIRSIVSSLTESYGISILNTPDVAYSPFIPVKVDNRHFIENINDQLLCQTLRLMPPYAEDENPRSTKRPDVYRIRNPFGQLR